MIRAWVRRLIREYFGVCFQCGCVYREGLHVLEGNVCPVRRHEGRLTAAENSAAAANSRAQRLEAALARVEGRVAELESAAGPNARFIPKASADPASLGSEVTVSAEVPSCGS